MGWRMGKRGIENASSGGSSGTMSPSGIWAGAAKRADDFRGVARGDAVRVEGRGMYVHGTVDEVAPDGSVLWIREKDGHGRLMVHSTDAVLVHRVQPNLLEADRA